jgi:FixJ family two-component response regulator
MNGTNQSNVAIVDDDASVRAALARLLRTEGHSVQTFGCAQEFLQHPAIDDIGCLVLDVQLPDLNGLELQAALEQLARAPAVVFISGYGDIPMTVRAMRAGAVDFLTKPCDAEVFLNAVAQALQVDNAQRSRQRELTAERTRLASLTQREHEVLRGIIAGMRNKQIAAELAICEKTVKVHRAHIMDKMGVRSVAELVRMTEHAGADTGNSVTKKTSTEPQTHAHLCMQA